jgi:hypothetical protein
VSVCVNTFHQIPFYKVPDQGHGVTRQKFVTYFTSEYYYRYIFCFFDDEVLLSSYAFKCSVCLSH